MTSKQRLCFSDDPYIKAQILFCCQQHLGNNLIGHPVVFSCLHEWEMRERESYALQSALVHCTNKDELALGQDMMDSIQGGSFGGKTYFVDIELKVLLVSE